MPGDSHAASKRVSTQKWELFHGRHRYFRKELTSLSSPQIEPRVYSMLRLAACQEEKWQRRKQEIQKCYTLCNWIVVCFKHSFVTLIRKLSHMISWQVPKYLRKSLREHCKMQELHNWTVTKQTEFWISLQSVHKVCFLWNFFCMFHIKEMYLLVCFSFLSKVSHKPDKASCFEFWRHFKLILHT